MVEIATSSWNSAPSQRWLHRFAVLVALATFPLIVLGGLVTSYKAGLADTVWPTSPWYLAWLVWAGHAMERGLGFFIEHGHRQLGWIVGLLTTILSIWLWFGQPRAWLRWLGVIALAAVAVQGVLGGLRVLRIDPGWAVVHACFAQAFFALMVCLANFTSHSWSDEVARAGSSDAGRLQRLGVITTAFVYLQVIFGATLRHLGLPWALVAHLIVALVILLHVGLIAKRVFVRHSQRPTLVRPVEVLCLLLAGQLLLGAGAWAATPGSRFGPAALTVPTGAQIFFATAHVAVGALMLAVCVVLTLNCYRYLAIEPGTESSRWASTRARDSRRELSTRPSVSSLEPRDLLLEGAR